MAVVVYKGLSSAMKGAEHKLFAMKDAFPENVRRLIEALVESDGRTPRELRQDLVAGVAPRPWGNAESHARLLDYLEAVRRHPWQISDADIASLTDLGYDEDSIFEITLSAALGAGLEGFRLGLAALGDED